MPKANSGGVAKAAEPFLRTLGVLAFTRPDVLLAWPGVSIVAPPLLIQLTGETACREPSADIQNHVLLKDWLQFDTEYHWLSRCTLFG